MSQIFTAIGGTPPYIWSALDALPAGLTLSKAGVLTGTPTMATAGAYYTVRVQDAVAATAIVELWVEVVGVAAPVPPVVEVLKREVAIAAVMQILITRPDLIVFPVMPVMTITISGIETVPVAFPVTPSMQITLSDGGRGGS